MLINYSNSVSPIHDLAIGPNQFNIGNNVFQLDEYEYNTFSNETTIKATRVATFDPFGMPSGSKYSALKRALNSVYGVFSNIINDALQPIKKIIFSGDRTIVFWIDGKKTIVKRCETDKNDRTVALAYAIAKRLYGNNTRVHKEIDPFASSNAQRVAILKYSLSKKGFNVDDIMTKGKVSYRQNGKQVIYTF